MTDHTYPDELGTPPPNAFPLADGVPADVPRDADPAAGMPKPKAVPAEDADNAAEGDKATDMTSESPGPTFA